MIYFVTLWLLPQIVLSHVLNCDVHSYILESNKVLMGGILRTLVADLPACTKHCTQISQCSGVLFMIDALGDPRCLIVDSTSQLNNTETILPDSILFSASKICLKNKCNLKKSSAFVKHSNRTLAKKSTIIVSEEGKTLEECLDLCLAREDCGSAVYGSSSQTCLITEISPHSVFNVRSHFGYDEEFDLFENNCRQYLTSSSHCTWMKLKSAGLPYSYDTKQRALTVDHCEQLCLERTDKGDICRSFTFDDSRSLCLMSQSGARLSGKSPLKFNKEYLTHGDLDDCVDLSLKCYENHLEVTSKSMKMFSGTLRTKKAKEFICNRNVSLTHEYSVKMGFEECGIERKGGNEPSYHGLVQIKEGSTSLITIRDKVLQVTCKIHNQQETQDIQLNVSMNVAGSENDVLSNSIILNPQRAVPEPPRPKFTIEVLDEEGKTTAALKKSEKAWISVKSHMSDHPSLSVSSLAAKFTTDKKKRIELLDKEGCIVDSDLITEVAMITPGEIRFAVDFDQFPEGSEFVYQAYIEPCSSQCTPKCLTPYMNQKHNTTMTYSEITSVSTRNRRSISPTQIQLTQDIYQVVGSRVVLLGRQTVTKPKESQGISIAEVEHTSFSASVHYCFFNDSTCLFTLVLAVVQLLLFSSCLCILYCYVQQYRYQRDLQATERTTGVNVVEQTRK